MGLYTSAESQNEEDAKINVNSNEQLMAELIAKIPAIKLQFNSKIVVNEYIKHVERKSNLPHAIPNGIIEIIIFYHKHCYKLEYLEKQHMHYTSDQIDLRFVMIDIGDEGCGKTAILNRFIYDKFDETSTANRQYVSRMIKFEDKTIEMILWNDTFFTFEDVALRKRGLIGMLQGLLFIFDVTNVRSFQTIKNHLERFKNISCNNYNYERVKCVLVGTKCDLKDKRKISTEEGIKLGNKYNIEYIEVSAKENANIEYVFISMLQDMIQSMNEKNIPKYVALKYPQKKMGPVYCT